MTRRDDLATGTSVASTLLPNVRTATAQGVTVDLLGYGEAVLVAHIATITDGTFAFDPEHSDDDSQWDNVPAGELGGAFVNATSAADDTVQEVTYRGNRRYVRCNVIVSGSPATGGPVGVTVLRGSPRRRPV